MDERPAYEYPFGPYRSANLDSAEIIVTTTTGFPMLYRVVCRACGDELETRFRLADLETFLTRFAFEPVA